MLRESTPIHQPHATVAVHLAASGWILPLPAGRRDPICQADKMVLLRLWGCAPFDLRGDARASAVYVCRERLAEDVGMPLAAIRKSLARLAAAGWIRRRGGGWDLAWSQPFAAESPAPQRAELTSRAATAPALQGVEPTPIRPLKGSGSAPQRAAINNPINKKVIEQERERSLVVFGERAHPESPATRPGQAAVTQQTLFDSEQTEPARDLAAEVFAYLVARIVCTKRDLGIRPARGPSVLSPAQRRAIEARIREQSMIEGRPAGPLAGLEACKQVIDVDEADSRRKGEISPWWNATTPFRNAANFDSRLGRWRENGDHQPFGLVVQRKPRRDLGFSAAVDPEELDQLLADVERGSR